MYSARLIVTLHSFFTNHIMYKPSFNKRSVLKFTHFRRKIPEKGILNINFQQIIVLIFANTQNFLYLCSRMIVTFEQTYLQELYTEGKASDKKHRFQPQIVSKYVKVVNLMKQQENVLGLAKYGSLHYEKLHGDKEGLSSVRVNDQYRIEFTESMEAGKQIATICNITELSNHYK